jgi:hypothetical protein
MDATANLGRDTEAGELRIHDDFFPPTLPQRSRGNDTIYRFCPKRAFRLSKWRLSSFFMPLQGGLEKTGITRAIICSRPFLDAPKYISAAGNGENRLRYSRRFRHASTGFDTHFNIEFEFARRHSRTLLIVSSDS